MSDFLGNNEVTSVSKRIMLPDQFDKRLSRDREFANQIDGCSTFSLSQITKDISPNHISIRPYPPDNAIRMVLNDDIFLMVSGEEAPEGLDYIKVNRIDYGSFWSSIELAEQKEVNKNIPYSELRRLMHEVYPISYHTKKVNNKQDMKDIIQALSRPNVKDLFIEGFKNWDNVADYFMELKDRGGVQVTYTSQRKHEFSGFIMDQKHEVIDDRAVEIYSSIPNKFIHTIIPVGIYEQKQINKFI